MREDKIRKNSEFRRVYKNGKSIANHLLVLYFYKNNKKYSRFGISVSKKVGKSVTRSRVKRLIRESTRLNEKHIASGYDIVVIARVSSNDKGYKEIEKALINLLKKAGLFCNEKDINKYN